ncbi:MAG: serine/threonine protein kinase [Planctomycetes bacterium]|nr:serine/threonine protein kinase [Planctomycetota bacterium]
MTDIRPTPEEDHADQRMVDSGIEATKKFFRDLFGREEKSSVQTVSASSGSPFKTFERLGDYEILRPLGRGGMGQVYLARQVSLGREVALKILPPELAKNSTALERFFREARAASAINHPFIVPVLEAGFLDGRPYIAMQLVRGVSVEEILAGGVPLKAKRALEIARDLARALQAAHDSGIIHRDIKPGNLLVEGDAASARLSGRVFLADFGLALLQGDETLTRNGEILGTPAYMSPEQACGLKVNLSSDVYSLGASLYAMLTGHAPFEGSSYAAILALVAREEPPPARRLNPLVPRDAATICEKAMRWEPKKRYASAGEFADDLDRWLGKEPIKARPATWLYRSTLWLKRNPRVALAVGISLFAALAAFLGLRTQQRDSGLAGASLLIGSGQFESAKTRLESIPGFPRLWSDRETGLWVQVSMKLGDLAQAFEHARGYSTQEKRGTALQELSIAVDEELDSGHALIHAELFWSGLLKVKNALGGIVGMLQGQDPLGRTHWAEERMAKALELGLRGLNATGQDLAAARFFENQNKPGQMKEILKKVFISSFANDNKPRVEESRDLWGLLERSISGESSPETIQAQDLLKVLDPFLPRLAPGEADQLARSVQIIKSMKKVGSPVNLKPLFPLFLMTQGDIDGDGVRDMVISGNKTIHVLKYTGKELELWKEFEFTVPVSVHGIPVKFQRKTTDKAGCEEKMV